MEPPVDVPAHRWPGPSLYTLLAWVEVELLLETGAQVDAAHAVVTDGAELAFGPGWVPALCSAAAAEGVPMDDGFPVLAELRADEDRARRVLDRLHAWMRTRADVPAAPPAPRDELQHGPARRRRLNGSQTTVAGTSSVRGADPAGRGWPRTGPAPAPTRPASSPW